MKRIIIIAVIALALIIMIYAALTPPPAKLTADQVKSLALAAGDLPEGYLPDNVHTGVVTYQSLVDEGSTQTAEYVKSLEGVQIYRSAFERTARVAGPLVIWTWVFVYKDETAARGYFTEHGTLYPNVRPPRAPFPKFGQESKADYSLTSSNGENFELYHIVLRQRNIVIYFAPLYEAGKASEDEIQGYAKLLESKLLGLLKSL